MNDYLEYMNSLSSVIADRNEEIAEAQRSYSSKLPGIEETKSIIETATGLPSGIFLEKGISSFLLKKEGRSYLQKTAKNVFNKGRQYYNDNYDKNTADRRATGGQEAQEPSETTTENPTFDPEQTLDPVEGTPFEEGTPIDLDAGEEASGLGETRLYSLKEIAQDPQLYKSYIKQTQPSFEGGDDVIESSRATDLSNIENGFEDGSKTVLFNPNESGTAQVSSESAVRDQLAPMRDMMEQQPQGQENGGTRPEQSSGGDAEAGEEGGEVAQQDSIGTSTDISNALKSATGGGEGLAEGGEALAEGGSALGEGGSALAEGIGAALDFDPFTALIGLFVGLGGLIGGIEGAKSVKNPAEPKLPAQELVSVVKGAGGF